MRILALLLAVAGCGDNGSAPTDGGGGAPDAAVDLSIPSTTLATAQTSCLELHGGRLFFVDETGGTNAVASVPIAGGMKQTHATGAAPKPCVAVDDTYVYWATSSTDADAAVGDTLWRAAWATAGAPQMLAASQHALSRVRVANGKLWWITDLYGPGDGMFSGKDAIVSMPADGSGAVTVVFSDLTPKGSRLAVDAANVYYSDGDGMYVRAINGGAPTKVGMSSLHNNAFAVDAMHLAVVEPAGSGMGDVALFQLDGSQRKVLSPSLATALAVDASGVYANQNGKLVRLALDGSGATELQTVGARDIALDATGVYFTDGASVLKLAK